MRVHTHTHIHTLDHTPLVLAVTRRFHVAPLFLKCDASRCLPCLTPALSLLPPAGVSEGGAGGRSRTEGLIIPSTLDTPSFFIHPVCVLTPLGLCSQTLPPAVLSSSDSPPVYCSAFFALSLPPPNAALLGQPSPNPQPPSRGKKITNPCAELTFVSFSFLFLVKYYRLFCWKKNLDTVFQCSCQHLLNIHIL